MKTTRPTRGPQRRRKNAGTGSYNKPLTDQLVATIWTLTEEDRSQRAIGELLGVAPSQVSKELGRDPIRLEALRARQREERAKRWKRLETVGVDELLEWAKVLKDARPEFTSTRKHISQRRIERLAVLPRILTALRGVAAEGSKQTQLLTGGATERVGQEQPSELSAEQLVAQAIERGLVDRLPERLREYAKTVQRTGSKET
jgi:IS30 family transposase